MGKISEFRIGKGLTTRPSEKDEIWTKRYLEFTVKMPEQFTDKDLQNAILSAEYAIDNFLGQPAAAQIPEFNPEELMKHEWKGKKTGEGTYSKGTLAWGWDFRDKFKPETIQVLEKGPLTVDEYEFTMGDTIISVKKKRNGDKEK